MSYIEVTVKSVLEGKHDGQIVKEHGKFFLYDGDRLNVDDTAKRLIAQGYAIEEDGVLKAKGGGV